MFCCALFVLVMMGMMCVAMIVGVNLTMPICAAFGLKWRLDQ